MEVKTKEDPPRCARDQSLRLQASGFRGSGSLVPCFGLWGSGFAFGMFVFRASCVVLRVESQVLGFGFRGFGFHVSRDSLVDSQPFVWDSCPAHHRPQPKPDPAP
jgi:hypothetical protein